MSTEKRDFNSEAAQWDTPPRIKASKEIVSALINRITLNKTWDIMDFGCGTGLLTMQLSPQVKSVTAVDSSSGMLNILNNKISDGDVANIRTMQIDPDNGENLTGMYDLIISSMTLHHLKDIRFIIGEFYRILKNQGSLCIADLDLDKGQFHPDNTGVFHFGFDRDELKKIFMESGFKNISVETATSITKPAGSSQIIKQFSIFLISGQKIK